MSRIVLHPGREKSLRRRHPWVFSGAVARIEGSPLPGETVEVADDQGTPLGLGAWSPSSKIPVRIWTFDVRQPVDRDFFRSRARAAWASREAWLARTGDTACRVVHAEADGLPGVVADLYGDRLVLQLLTAGAERWRGVLAEALAEAVPGVAGVFERSDPEVRTLEALPPRTGSVTGPEPPPLVEVLQGGSRFLVDVRRGHKTGFYLDQRDNRARIAPWLRGARVLNVFSYTGAFAVDALRAGAEQVTNVDSSQDALDLCRRNAAVNGLDGTRLENLRGDAFQLLRRLAEDGAQYDAVILDPPKFADSRAALEGALRGYKDMNLLGLRLLRPGGLLATFSCSGLVDPEAFRRSVSWAAMDLALDVQVLQELHQATDHPVPLAFPEASYLKGLLARVS